MAGDTDLRMINLKMITGNLGMTAIIRAAYSMIREGLVIREGHEEHQ